MPRSYWFYGAGAGFLVLAAFNEGIVFLVIGIAGLVAGSLVQRYVEGVDPEGGPGIGGGDGGGGD